MPEDRFDTKMPLECGDCHTKWDEHFSLPMNVEAFTKRGKAILCPNCCGNKINMLPMGGFYIKDEDHA